MSKTFHIRVKDIVYTIFVIVVLLVGISIVSKYNYNNFTKSVREKGKTTFSRDSEVKYIDDKSYKIENSDYNDAMFFQTIPVEENTAYKVSCKVKTEDVINENNKYTGGAQISIRDTTECSKSVVGTNDWTELTFLFDSKNRTSVELGFRLGGYEELSKGTAWFTDFKIEEGMIDSDKNWHMACFIIENIDVNINLNGEMTNVKLSMSSSDINDIETNMQRLPATFKELSNGKMTMDYDIFRIKDTLTSVSYDEENEYYVDPGDVHNLISEYIEKEEYDYIFVAVRLGNINNQNEVLVHDWIGLGGMDYYGIGYSNIRLPDTANSYIYKYDSTINRFPEETFVHEFLHTLERNETEYGNVNLARLHDYEQYGYDTEPAIGLREWYRAYMNNTIKNSDGTSAGLTLENAYKSKPIHESNLKYSYEVELFKEPDNIIESIISIIDRIKLLFEKDERTE